VKYNGTSDGVMFHDESCPPIDKVSASLQ